MLKPKTELYHIDLGNLIVVEFNLSRYAYICIVENTGSRVAVEKSYAEGIVKDKVDDKESRRTRRN